MRQGPLITLCVGIVFTLGGVIGLYFSPSPKAANGSWGSVGDRVAQPFIKGNDRVDPAYMAQQRRFGWAALAAIGVITIMLAIAAQRQK